MSAQVPVEALTEVRCTVGESPLWSAAERALYWVDIEGRCIHRWQAASGQSLRWPLAERPGCIALHASGGLLCALEASLVHLVLHDDGHVDVTTLASVTHSQPGMRFNDGRCDRAGRFWVGSMVMNMALVAPAGLLYRLHDAALTRGLLLPLVVPLIVPNGLAFSPNGRTLYLSDSHPTVQCIWAFDLSDDGTPTRQRVFVDMHQHPGRPDGAAVDVDGAYWTCANDAGLVHRFTPDGRLDRSVAVPVSKPSMCAFGGAQMDELYITSIRPATPPPGEAALAGATFVCRPGVQGLAETPFKTAPGTAR
jgi:sugar lactone lactonase YvrE